LRVDERHLSRVAMDTGYCQDYHVYDSTYGREFLLPSCRGHIFFFTRALVDVFPLVC
jgi:hypothetical protein